jgi:diguanylate cyclase (GGDEF)-like protein
MSEPAAPPGRTRRSWTTRISVVLIGVATVVTVAGLGVNAIVLGQVNARVQAAQSQSLNLSHALRESLFLLQSVTAFGESADANTVAVRRGLLVRQLTVTIASYPADSAQARELAEVSAAIQRFPWYRMAAAGGRGGELRLLAMALVSQSEKRVQGLHVATEQDFYAATIASLDTALRGQVGSVVLAVLVLVLGLLGVARLTRRNRSDLAVAYDKLKSEVVERRAAEDKLFHQAHHDSLTGLPNRALLLRRLRDALGGTGQAAVSVILVDLDGFKNVNDTLGHPAGDELLRMAAQRLVGCVRDGDTAARLGGDEFAVLTSGNGSTASSALAVGRRIVDVLHRPYPLAGQDVRVSASIGISHGSRGESAEDLLRDADIAMYEAKNTGKGRVEVFDPYMRTRTAVRSRLQQELARAVDQGEIEVHYQPIVDLRTHRPTIMEALARWRREDGSLEPSGGFIPIAEESGVIVDIGRVVLRAACVACRRWRRLPGYGGLAVAVNVSVQQVLSGRLADDVSAALHDSGLPPTALILEITESTALDEAERVVAELTALRATGVRIAVDDFGAGYSSLQCLMRMPADLLKIDRTLLDFDTTRHGSLVTAVAELGRTLGLLVVVEGVETTEHLTRAREAACNAAQGFHFSRPLATRDVPDYLTGRPLLQAAEQGVGSAER